jgi:hypothetical protein
VNHEQEFPMNRNHAFDDDNFTTVLDTDGKPTRILKDKGRVRISLQMRDALARGDVPLWPTGQGERGQRGEAVGDRCTIDGKEGRLRRVDGQMQCVANQSQDARPAFVRKPVAFVDGNGNPLDLTAGNRPGYRISTSDARQKVMDAYAKADRRASNTWKVRDGQSLCEDCDGEGYDEDGNVCETCNGDGVMPEVADEREEGKSLFGSGNGTGRSDDPDPASDSRTRDQHRKNLDRLYRERDAELSQMWRRS